ncbi:hypothetical protein PR202_ga28114 [Eleusine coracana subsp. coracana]|uniref:PHD-type domain-containing protein n=1 Tax=Eleusine coracana subsp. coracana TaxID=191504 RepID=A0AAV5DHW7_ELECO|nr:hypothetical protein PR202_ga28114 [Eleusine coracana subsp. coracana]
MAKSRPPKRILESYTIKGSDKVIKLVAALCDLCRSEALARYCRRFCKCEMPYNPDDLMIQCEECSDWFHPSCVGMTTREAKRLEHFFCQSCNAENGKMAENSHEATAQSEEKVDYGVM